MTAAEWAGNANLDTGRRHDLDALRAFAMLLGIGLHASLSFFPAPWPVQDSRQNGLLGLLFLLIHGFRMPLFFIVSGYFTMLVYRKRGLASLLRQRALRILLPCLLGLATIIPLTEWISGRAIVTRAPAPAPGNATSLAAAIRAGDAARIESFLAVPEQVNRPDDQFGIGPLHWAVLKQDLKLIERLIEKGADVNQSSRDGNRPLHAAAFLGSDGATQLLLERQADPNARNLLGEVPVQATQVDWETTRYIVAFLGTPVPDARALLAGREQVRQRLSSVTKVATAADGANLSAAMATPGAKLAVWRNAYQEWLRSDRWQVAWGDRSWHLIQGNVFSHLWFLWFLCWMVAGFAALAPLLARIPRATDARRLSFGLIPLTILPQAVMGAAAVSFGPDTSTGLLPQPHLLFYYGLFFAFGVLTFVAEEQGRKSTARGWLGVSIAVFFGFPLWLLTVGNFTTSLIAQVVYVWALCLGLTGLFRRYLPSESPWVRYLSDSSYWLYLAHLPLVMALQWLVRDWPVDALLKFVAINVASLIVLLATYHWLVRRTWLGVLLNGRRAPALRRACPAGSND